MLQLEDIPTPHPQIVSRVLEGEAVLVLPDQGKVKVLNEVGAFIWGQINGRRNIGEIAAEICAQYDVTPENAQQDVLAFIAGLARRGIVTILP